jgi:hypothetical protein
MNTLKDKDGVSILVGDFVLVDGPVGNDIHQHGFIGTVVEIKFGAGLVTVRDQDDDCFDVEHGKVTVQL